MRSVSPALRVGVLPYIVIAMESAFYAAVSPLVPELKAELGLTDSAAGILVAAYPIGLLVGSVPAGLIASVAGLRTAASLGLGLVAGASAWFALGSSVESLQLARGIQGVGGALCWCAALVWVVASSPRERHARAIGGALGVAIVGVLLGPVIGALATQLGRAPVFLAVGGLAAVLVWPVLATAPSVRSTAPLRTVGRSLVGREARIGAWVVVVTGVIIGAATVLAPLRLDGLGAGPLLVAALFVVGGVLEAIASPVAGAMTDRIGPLPPIAIALGTGVMVLGGLAVVLPLSVVVLLFIVLLPGVGLLLTPANALLNGAAVSAGVPAAAAFTLGNVAWACGEAAGAVGAPTLAALTMDAAPYLMLAGLCAATLFWIKFRGASQGDTATAEEASKDYSLRTSRAGSP